MSQMLSAIPDELKHRHFMGFSPKTDPAEAQTAFERRHGQPPALIITVPNTLLVGPLPQPAPRQMMLAEAV